MDAKYSNNFYLFIYACPKLCFKQCFMLTEATILLRSQKFIAINPKPPQHIWNDKKVKGGGRELLFSHPVCKEYISLKFRSRLHVRSWSVYFVLDAAHGVLIVGAGRYDSVELSNIKLRNKRICSQQ